MDGSQRSEGVRSSSSDMFQIFGYIFEEKYNFARSCIFFVKISGFSGFREKFQIFFSKHHPNCPKMKSGEAQGMELILDGEIMCTRTSVLEISGFYSEFSGNFSRIAHAIPGGSQATRNASEYHRNVLGASKG